MLNRLLPLLLVLFAYPSNAQITTNSPFTSYGLGEKGGLDHAAFTGLGNTTATYFDSTVLNFYNPATYNTLGKGQPLFSLGLTSRLSFYNQSNLNQFKGTAFVEHFALAFTLKKHFGLAFGLKPFARKGYAIYDRVAVGSDSLKYSYLGTGGTNQFFVGLSSDLIRLKQTRLSVGTNISYLFGTSTNERRSQLIDANSFSGGVDWNSTRVKSLHYEIGAFFTQTVAKKHTFTLAAVVEPAQKIHATKDEYLFYGVLGDPKAYDTLYANVDQKGTLNMPVSNTLGFSYKFQFSDLKKNNTSRNSELAIHASFSTTDWSRYSSTFETSSALPSTQKLTLGVQYIPEREFLENAISAKFLEKVRYRAGYYQYSLPYTLNGIQLTDKGITLGFGIPILSQRSLSSVNFSLSAGKRGNNVAGSYNEKYIGINFGVVLAPSNYDRWFVKRKLD